MKKFLKFALCFILALGIASCKKTNKEAESIISNAKEFVYDLYKDTTSTNADYTVVESAAVGDKKVEIVWEIVGSEVVTLGDSNEDGTRTILVNYTPETCPTETTYTLKGTFKYDGEEATLEFTRTVPAFKLLTHDEYMAITVDKNNKQSVTVKAVLTGKSIQTSGSNYVQYIYFQDDNGGYQVYGYNMGAEGALSYDELVIGKTYYIYGGAYAYYNQVCIADATLKAVSDEVKSVDYLDVTSTLAAYSGTSEDEAYNTISKDLYGEKVEIKNVEATDIYVSSSSVYLDFVKGDFKGYIYISSKYASNNWFTYTEEELQALKDGWVEGCHYDVKGIGCFYYSDNVYDFDMIPESLDGMYSVIKDDAYYVNTAVAQATKDFEEEYYVTEKISLPTRVVIDEYTATLTYVASIFKGYKEETVTAETWEEKKATLYTCAEEVYTAVAEDAEFSAEAKYYVKDVEDVDITYLTGGESEAEFMLAIPETGSYEYTVKATATIGEKTVEKEVVFETKLPTILTVAEFKLLGEDVKGFVTGVVTASQAQVKVEEDVYTAASDVTAENWSEKKASLYTCADEVYTAVAAEAEFSAETTYYTSEKVVKYTEKKSGAVLTDATGSIYINTYDLLQVGQQVTLRGVHKTYKGLEEIEYDIVYGDVTTPASYLDACLKEITTVDTSAALDTVVTENQNYFVKITGKLVASGSYYNIVDSEGTTIASPYASAQTTATYASLADQEVDAYGYIIGYSSYNSKYYLKLMVTEVLAKGTAYTGRSHYDDTAVDYGTVEAPISVEAAYDILDKQTSTTAESMKLVTVEGTVIAKDFVYNSTNDYYILWLVGTDSTKAIEIYGGEPVEGVSVIVGDKVVVSGYGYKWSNSCRELTGIKHGTDEKIYPVIHSASHQEYEIGYTVVDEDGNTSTDAVVSFTSANKTNNGTNVTFTVTPTENHKVNVYYQDSLISEVDNVYTVTVGCESTIKVVTLYDDGTIDLTLDFAANGNCASNMTITAKANAVQTANTIVVDGITYSYVGAYDGGSYMMLAKSGAGTSPNQTTTHGFVYNTTAIPGTINSITVYTTSSASGKTTYGVTFGVAELSAKQNKTNADWTGIKDSGITITNSVENANYFQIEVTNSNNGQIAKIVINYTPAK